MAKTSDELCKNVNVEIKEQALTLANAILAMQSKIETEIPKFEKFPIAQQVISTQGEKVLKSNPYTQEFRAIVRDYATALQSLQSLLGLEAESVTDKETIEDFRKKFKIAK